MEKEFPEIEIHNIIINKIPRGIFNGIRCDVLEMTGDEDISWTSSILETKEPKDILESYNQRVDVFIQFECAESAYNKIIELISNMISITNQLGYSGKNVPEITYTEIYHD